MCLFACSMNWTHCEMFWDLDFEPSEKTRGGQAVALFGLSRTPKPPKVIGCFTRGGHA